MNNILMIILLKFINLIILNLFIKLSKILTSLNLIKIYFYYQDVNKEQKYYNVKKTIKDIIREIFIIFQLKILSLYFVSL
jgi:hypothetical protein